MADDVAVLPFRFDWIVYNPFILWRRTVAIFYQGSPTLTVWKVTLEPESRPNPYTWPFSFSLKRVKDENDDEISERVEAEDDDAIFADRLVVDISEDNHRNVARKEEIDYTFDRSKRHSYQFQTSMTPGQSKLYIQVVISFRIQNIVNRRGNGLRFQSEDLIQLSEDLKRLFTHSIDSNLRLRSRDISSNFRVHSYILRARWSNFFKHHPVSTIADNTVDTQISHDLLEKILTYMYSGELDSKHRTWIEPFYMTELYQVIDKYHLYHLYRVFARDESTQYRSTDYDMCDHRITIRASRVDGKPLKQPKGTWQVIPRNGVSVDVKLKFFLNENNPWFLYSLTFTCSIALNARVHLRYRRKGQRIRLFRVMHEREYKISGNETVDSGTCHFEGDLRSFDRFLRGDDRRESGKVVEHSFCFILYVSEGNKVIKIWSADIFEFQDDRKRFEVLSDHMYELLKQRDEADARTDANLQVVCRTEYPNLLDIHSLHKAIFAARVPKWRAVLRENLPEGNGDDELEDNPGENDIPDEMSCFLSSRAFQHVLDYIYTGKLSPIPFFIRYEIEEFAARGGLNHLRRLCGLKALRALH